MSARPIKTVYYRHGKADKITRAGDANRAVATAVLHMQVSQYGAHACEVYDDDTGELHAAMRWSKSGALTISYMRDPRDHETKYAVGYILSK